MCRRYGTLLVLDEVQTGMFRTGRFLAAHHFGLEPDMVILAKALSGGFIPVGAVPMSDEIYNSVYGSLKRAIVRSGLATLNVLERGRLGERASSFGAALRGRLTEALSGFEMVKEVRGLGMLSGIEFAAPRQLRLRIAFETFRKIHPGMFGQVLVMRLFRDRNIPTQIRGNNFLVLKVAPPLVVSEAQLDEFVSAIRDVIEEVHSSNSFWSEALSLAGRAINI